MGKNKWIKNISFISACALREKCSNTEFFLLRIFLYLDFIPWIPVFSPNTGKYGPEKTPSLDTFRRVEIYVRKLDLRVSLKLMEKNISYHFTRILLIKSSHLCMLDSFVRKSIFSDSLRFHESKQRRITKKSCWIYRVLSI